MNVFEVVASLILDSSKYDESLESAEEKGSSFGDKLKSGLATGSKIAVGAITALTTATIAGGKALIDATGAVAAQGDEIDKQSQKLGISATAYQEWDAILQHSGSSVKALKPAIRTLQAEVEKGNEAFQALGFTQEEVASMSSEELFASTITALQNMTDENERTAIASELLGRSYMEMGPLLNTSVEDTEAMRQAVHDLGGVMSDDMVKASAAYQDTLQDMNTAIDGTKRSVIETFLPSITDVMGGLTQLFSGDASSGIGQITNGVNNFIKQLLSVAPQLTDVASQLISNFLTVIIENLPAIVMAGTDLLFKLVEGILDNLPALVTAVLTLVTTVSTYIIQNLPTILQKGIEIVKSIAQGMIDNLPTIIQSIGDILMAIVEFIINDLPELLEMGIELIFALAEGIISNLPAIISAILEVITSILNYIIEHLADFVEMGIEIIVQLIAGLIEAIPEIIAAIPQIIEAIFNAFSEVDWLSIGTNIIDGIVNGIGEAVSTLWDAAVNAAKTALSKIKSVLGIASPSKVFRDQVGKMIPEGMAIGIEANTDSVEDAMADIADLTTDPFAGMSNIVKFPEQGKGSQTYGGIVLNVYASEGMDVEEFADYTIDKLNQELEREGRALA